MPLRMTGMTSGLDTDSIVSAVEGGTDNQEDKG